MSNSELIALIAQGGLALPFFAFIMQLLQQGKRERQRMQRNFEITLKQTQDRNHEILSMLSERTEHNTRVVSEVKGLIMNRKDR